MFEHHENCLRKMLMIVFDIKGDDEEKKVISCVNFFGW